MEEAQQPPKPELKRKADEDDVKKEITDDCEPLVKSAKYENEEEKASSCEPTLTDPPSEIEKEEMSVAVPDGKMEISPSKNGDLDSKQQESVIDPLEYTRAEEFTSEIFKIQIHNMPKFGYGDFKKRLYSLGLKPHKIKCPRREVTYVCFRNETDRKTALEKINGHVWRGKTLDAKEAAPSVDPYLERKRQERQRNSDASPKVILTFEEAQKKLKDSVVPMWEMDYSKQLEIKTEKMTSQLKNLTHHPLVRAQFRQMESWRQDGMPCPLLPIVPSPVTSNYRNKNEFTVGYSQDGQTIKVGFRYGLYKDGTTSVGDATDIGVVKPAVVPIIESFEKFVSKSRWPPYLQQTSAGHWHTLVVRSFDSGDTMAMVDFHPRRLDKNELDQVKDSIRDFYTNGDGKGVDIKSFYFRHYAKGPEGVPRLDKIFGDSHVYESLFGLKFRISPEAFFQVNTKATEKLYSLIGDWCGASSSSTILDLCCGTGTIGLSMAQRVRHVIGVEMCEPAVEDAKENANLNNITNVTYFCSKVEDVIGKVLTLAFNIATPPPPPPPSSSSPPVTSSSQPLPSSSSALPCPATSSSESKSVEPVSVETKSGEPVSMEAKSVEPVAVETKSVEKKSVEPVAVETKSVETKSVESAASGDDIIAVVDPPRAGLHKSVIKMLRKTEEIKRLVYVSCNPENAMDNFVDLIRPSSTKLRGPPFNLVKAVPVDLFPGTKHCELVLLLTR